MKTAGERSAWNELAAPYWAAEEDLVWRYFGSPARTPASDAVWLRRQCFKEIWGSGVSTLKGGLFVGSVEFLSRAFGEIDRSLDRHDVLEVIDLLRSEFRHYCLFADLHDALSGGRLRPSALHGWAADDELARMRERCRARLGARGDLVVRFSEGGAGALYAAGMRLAGSGGFDERIAAACTQVYDDEIAHMAAGGAVLARVVPDPADAPELAEALRAMLEQRLRMRAEQFEVPAPRPHRPTAVTGA